MRRAEPRHTHGALQVRTVLSPRFGESADGLLARVAAAECAPRMLEFTRMAGATFGRHAALSRREPEGVALVARCIGVDPGDLAQRCTLKSLEPREIAFFGLTIDDKHIAGRVRRYAPASLETSAHHRALWMLKPFPFCEESWQLLLDRCPSPRCEAVQRWHWTNGIDICDRCGEQLIRASAAEVPAALRRDLRHAVGLMHPDPARREESRSLLPADLRAADGGALLDLLSAVAGVVDPSIRYAPNRRIIDPTAAPPAVATATAAAWSVLKGWPVAFEHLIADRLSTRKGRFGDGNQGASLAFLQLPVRAMMHPDAVQTISAVSARLQSNAGEGYRAVDAALRLGITVSELTAARRRRDLPTIFHLGVGELRPRPLVGRAAVEAMAARPMMPRYSLNILLGATPRTIDELLHRDILESGGLARGDKGERLVRASVESLVTGLGSASRPLADDAMPLRKAMRIVGGRFKPWAAALAAMLGGEIVFAFDDSAKNLIDGIRIPSASVGRLLDLPGTTAGDVPFPTMLSKTEAIEILNLRPCDGISVLGVWKATPGATTKIPTVDVFAIATAQVAAAEAALRLSIEPREVRYVMARAGVRRLSDAGYERVAFEALMKTRGK